MNQQTSRSSVCIILWEYDVLSIPRYNTTLVEYAY